MQLDPSRTLDSAAIDHLQAHGRALLTSQMWRRKDSKSAMVTLLVADGIFGVRVRIFLGEGCSSQEAFGFTSYEEATSYINTYFVETYR